MLSGVGGFVLPRSGRLPKGIIFRPDFPTAEAGIQLTQAFFASPDVFGVVAEKDGEVVGSNHLWEYDAIRAVGPITVDPNAQAKDAG